MAVLNGKLYLIGGFDNRVRLMNDVWSSDDGAIWTQLTAAAFSARIGHQVVAFKNKLYLIGGLDGGAKNDVWSSADGSTWRSGFNGTFYFY